MEAKDHCWSNNPGTEKRKNAKEKATGGKVEEEAVKRPWRYRSTEKPSAGQGRDKGEIEGGGRRKKGHKHAKWRQKTIAGGVRPGR